MRDYSTGTHWAGSCSNNWFSPIDPTRCVHSSQGGLLLLRRAPLFRKNTGSPQEKTEDLEMLISRLEFVDLHEAFVLLKNCFSILKLQYILRSSPTFLCQDELVRCNEKVRDELQALLNVDLQDGA